MLLLPALPPSVLAGGEGLARRRVNMRLIATTAASLVREDRSAPTKPGVFLAMRLKSTSPPRVILDDMTCIGVWSTYMADEASGERYFRKV